MVVGAGRRVTLEDVAGRALAPARYLAVVEANGARQCVMMDNGRARCVDVMIGRAPPGMIATCIPTAGARGSAAFVPNHAEVGDGECEPGGFLASAVPLRQGVPNGLAETYLEDGRLLSITPFRDGRATGSQLQLRSTYDGAPQPAERPFHDGVIDRAERPDAFDARLHAEHPFQTGQPSGWQQEYVASGQLGEAWLWEEGSVTVIQLFDEHGAKIAERNYDRTDLAHGTFCRANHVCTQW
jgi:hypothetical protein